MTDKVRGPLSDAEKAQIEQLHAEGMGRNAIARELNRPWTTITNYCREHGLSFTDTRAMEGVEARRLRAAQRRADLALQLLDDAERLREQMFEPHTVVQYGGKDFRRVQDTFDEPSPADKRNLAQAAATLLDRSIKLEDYDRTGTGDEARSMLGQLGALLTAAATPQMPPDPDDEAPGEPAG